MNEKVNKAMEALSSIDAKDLDECSIEELAQFHYWLMKWPGSIFVKTVGRVANVFRGC